MGSHESKKSITYAHHYKKRQKILSDDIGVNQEKNILYNTRVSILEQLESHFPKCVSPTFF